MSVSEIMNVFLYVILNWRQHQKGECKYQLMIKLEKVIYTCIKRFFCHYFQTCMMQRRKKFNISPF